MRRLAACTVTGLLALGLSACAGDGAQVAAFGEEEGLLFSGPIEKAKLRIGIKFDQPGVGYFSEGAEQPSGFDVDVAMHLAFRLGYAPSQVEWVEALSPYRVDLLAEGEVDLVVASFPMSDDAREAVTFAGPYLVTHQGLLVRWDNTDLATLADLPGKTICAPEGTPWEARIREMTGETATVITRVRHTECLELVSAGQADAMTTSNLNLAGLAADDGWFGEFKLLDETFGLESIGVGLPKGDLARCEQINAALQTMVEDGTWQRFLNRYTRGIDFTPDPEFNPPTPADCS